MERRKNERHVASGTAWFHWKDSAETNRQETGTLRDFSAEGLFIETISAPPVGTEVLVQFEFSNAATAPSVTISAKGRVNRIETNRSNGDDSGFALATKRMKLNKPTASKTSFAKKPVD